MNVLDMKRWQVRIKGKRIDSISINIEFELLIKASSEFEAKEIAIRKSPQKCSNPVVKSIRELR